MTGWNMPPGCNYRDIDAALGLDQPCDVCGKMEEDCICPECPTCSAHGDKRCYEEHGLVRTQEQIDSLKEMHDAIEADAKAENAYYEQMLEDEAKLEKMWSEYENEELDR